MNTRTVLLIVGLLLLAAVGTSASLFWIQNSARQVMLSLNLGFTQLQLAEPVSIPVLMAICLGAGVVLGGALLLPLLARANAKARQAQRSAALGLDSDY